MAQGRLALSSCVARSDDQMSTLPCSLSFLLTLLSPPASCPRLAPDLVPLTVVLQGAGAWLAPAPEEEEEVVVVFTRGIRSTLSTRNTDPFKPRTR